jgi:chromosome segregation ATPase
MNLSQSNRTLLTEEEKLQHKREAQQRYYQKKKKESETDQNEVMLLRQQLQYVIGKIMEMEKTQEILRSQLNERTLHVNLLQQIVTEKDIVRGALESKVKEQEKTIEQLRKQICELTNEERNTRVSELQSVRKDTVVSPIEALNKQWTSFDQLKRELAETALLLLEDGSKQEVDSIKITGKDSNICQLENIVTQMNSVVI